MRVLVGVRGEREKQRKIPVSSFYFSLPKEIARQLFVCKSTIKCLQLTVLWFPQMHLPQLICSIYGINMAQLPLAVETMVYFVLEWPVYT